MEFWARRPLSKNLIGAIAFIAAVYLMAMLVQRVPRTALPSEWLLPVQCLMLAAAQLLVTRFVDRMPAAWSGLGLHRWTLREIGIGVALGGAMAAAAAMPGMLIGGVQPGSGIDAGALVGVLVPFAIAAAGEELLFRGYLFQRAAEVLGPATAAILSSAVFAIAHLGNPSASAASTAVIFLGGIFFALLRIRTNALWMPIGAHITWNLVTGNVLGLPVSGHDFGPTLWRVASGDPVVITGGAFGPEGGVAAVVVLVAGIWLVARHRLFITAPYANAVTARGVIAGQLRARAAG